MGFIYKDPSINYDEAIRLLASDTDANVIAALVSIGLNETDRKWAQDICLKHLTSTAEAIVAAAATALGHIARRHGEVDTEIVFVKKHINQFVKIKQNRGTEAYYFQGKALIC